MELFHISTDYNKMIYCFGNDVVEVHNKYKEFIKEYINTFHSKDANLDIVKAKVNKIYSISKVGCKVNQDYNHNMSTHETNIWHVIRGEAEELRIGDTMGEILSEDITEITLYTESSLIIN